MIDLYDQYDQLDVINDTIVSHLSGLPSERYLVILRAHPNPQGLSPVSSLLPGLSWKRLCWSVRHRSGRGFFSDSPVASMSAIRTSCPPQVTNHGELWFDLRRFKRQLHAIRCFCSHCSLAIDDSSIIQAIDVVMLGFFPWKQGSVFKSVRVLIVEK